MNNTVYESATRAACTERALVLQSVGIAHEVVQTETGFALMVSFADRTKAAEELQHYAAENRDWRPRVPVPRLPPGGWPGVAGYVAVLLLIPTLQSQQIFATDWFAAGRMNSGLVLAGQWWRTVTALTLHLDLGHLAGNLVFGALFGIFAGKFLGSGLAWFSILIAGATGNLLNAFLTGPQHTSAGASTAVFAALGLLSAYTWKRRGHFDDRWVYRFAPVIGGVALLAYTGAGGERTDVGAHLTGFGAGLAMGAGYGWLGDRIRPGRRTQVTLGLASAGVLGLAWWAALS